MRLACLALSCVLVAASAFGQVATSYTVKYYAAGSATALPQSDTVVAALVICNAVPWAWTTVNPNRIAFTDPNNAGRVCHVQVATPSALPIGEYEATLTAVNAAGASTESDRAAFSRAITPPPTPSGFHVVR